MTVGCSHTTLRANVKGPNGNIHHPPGQRNQRRADHRRWPWSFLSLTSRGSFMLNEFLQVKKWIKTITFKFWKDLGRRWGGRGHSSGEAVSCCSTTTMPHATGQSWWPPGWPREEWKWYSIQPKALTLPLVTFSCFQAGKKASGESDLSQHRSWKRHRKVTRRD